MWLQSASRVHASFMNVYLYLSVVFYTIFLNDFRGILPDNFYVFNPYCLDIIVAAKAVDYGLGYWTVVAYWNRLYRM